MDLKTKLGPLVLQNPITTASGTFGYGVEFEPFFSLDKLGAINLKGTTLESRKGNAPIRIAETPSGMLNAIGLQNNGVDTLINTHLPKLNKYKNVKVIINVSGNTVEDYQQVVEKLESVNRVDAIEVNISCPNVKEGGMAFGVTTEGASKVTKAVRKLTKKPLIVKLSPNVTDIVSIATAVVDEGADILSLINTVLGMAVDVKRRQPVLSTVTGGLSGPAVKPIAIRMIWQIRQALRVPILGMGGIMSGQDVLEFMMAGSDAVAIGTGSFKNPHLAAECVDYLEQYMNTEKITSLDEIRGIV